MPDTIQPIFILLKASPSLNQHCIVSLIVLRQRLLIKLSHNLFSWFVDVNVGVFHFYDFVSEA